MDRIYQPFDPDDWITTGSPTFNSNGSVTLQWSNSFDLLRRQFDFEGGVEALLILHEVEFAAGRVRAILRNYASNAELGFHQLRDTDASNTAILSRPYAGDGVTVWITPALNPTAVTIHRWSLMFAAEFPSILSPAGSAPPRFFSPYTVGAT